MAKSQRRRDFEKENGASIPLPHEPNHVMLPTDEGLFDLVNLNAPSPVESHEIESPVTEPYIGIEGTKISTRGSNLASTALKNIMDTFNRASEEGGLKKGRPSVPDHRFDTNFGGRNRSLPHKVAGFMESDTLNATLDERGVIKVSDPKQQREPKHKKDLDILNNTALKLAEGRDKEIIAAEQDALKNWLIANYGPDATQTVDAGEYKVTYEDRKKLVKKVQELEEDAKKIASGEMLPYGSIAIDEEPMSDEERDIVSQDERELKDQ